MSKTQRLIAELRDANVTRLCCEAAAALEEMDKRLRELAHAEQAALVQDAEGNEGNADAIRRFALAAVRDRGGS